MGTPCLTTKSFQKIKSLVGSCSNIFYVFIESETLIKSNTKKFYGFGVLNQLFSEPQSWCVVVFFFVVKIETPSFGGVYPNSPFGAKLFKITDDSLQMVSWKSIPIFHVIF